jgi:hemerythrin-like metal-binding protein
MDIPVKGLLPAELVIGFAPIDAQHEDIFYRIERLRDACCDTDVLPEDIVADLFACLREHFATEESCALERGIDFTEHHQKHEATLVALQRAADRVRLGKADIFSLLRYLEIWFERHILDEDRPFARQVIAAPPQR